MRFDIIELDLDNNIRVGRYRGTRKEAREVNSSADREPEAVFLTARTEKTMRYEIILPAKVGRKATEAILFNELSEKLPVNPEDVHWFYRGTGGTGFSVCVVHNSEVDRILRVAAEHSLKFDRLVPAALAETPEEVLRTVAPEPLPATFRPIRFWKWKAAYLVLLFFCLGVFILVLAGKYRVFSREYRQLRETRELLSADLRKQHRMYAKFSVDRELLAEIRNVRIGWNGIGPTLAVLTKRLPASMWVTRLIVNDRTANLTVSAAQDDVNLYGTIGDSACYSIVNLKKNRGVDNRIMFVVKLEGKEFD